MRVLITRSGADAESLAGQLGERGFESLIEPLLHIQNRHVAAPDFSNVQAIIITSSNGVRALAQATERRDLRVLAVGESSARTAREAGFSKVESADGDVPALGDLIEKSLDAKAGVLFHAAGADLAGDLERRVEAAGFTYRRQVLYQAVAPRSLSPAAVAAIKDGSVEAVLFYSPRTAEIFHRLARKARIIKGCRQMTAYCLSPNVAAAARKIPWRDIRVASRPAEARLLSLLEPTPGAASAEPSAAGGLPPEAGPDDQSRGLPWRIAAQTRGAGALFFALIVIAILIGGGLALWRGWPAGLGESWLAFLGNGKQAAQQAAKETAKETAMQRARIGDLTGRIEKLENKADLQKLEAEGDRLKAQLDGTLKRLGILENSLAQVKKTVAAISVSADTEARETLRRLATRLGQLEEAVAAPQTEKDAKLQTLETQIADLAKKFTPEPDVESRQAQAFLLALGQLREAVRSARSFGDELASLIAVAGGKIDMASLTARLSDHATEGIPTLGMLIESFEKLAGHIVLAESGGQARTWFQRTVARLRSSVRWRRTDDLQGVRAEAVVARAEGILATGNLFGAVKELEALSGEPAKVARSWLTDARALVLAEKVLAALQARAVARIAALDK